MGTSHVSLDEAAILTVGEVMISRPKTLPATPPSPTRAGSFRTRASGRRSSSRTAATPGSSTREGVAGEDDGAAVAALASTSTGTAAHDDTVASALERMDAAGTDRLAVVPPDGTLRGLVCLSRSHGQLCTDPR